MYHGPFEGLKGEDVMSRVRADERPRIPCATPPSYAALLELGWHAEPDKRPTAREIVALLEKMLAAMQGL